MKKGESAEFKGALHRSLVWVIVFDCGQSHLKPLNMLGHLKFLLESERGEDLSLRRFSPLDYSMKLSGPVECPFEGCGFQTDLGKTMISHQQRCATLVGIGTIPPGKANLSLGIAVWGHARRLSQRGTGATSICSPTASLWHVLFAKVSGQTECQGLRNISKKCMDNKT